METTKTTTKTTRQDTSNNDNTNGSSVKQLPEAYKMQAIRIARHIDFLDEQIKEIEEEQLEAIRKDLGDLFSIRLEGRKILRNVGVDGGKALCNVPGG